MTGVRDRLRRIRPRPGFGMPTAGVLAICLVVPVTAPQAQQMLRPDPSESVTTGPLPDPASLDGATVAQRGAAPAGLTHEEMTELQRLLNGLGFDVGPEDGVMGPRTRAGIMEFQALADLEEDGIPTPALLEKARDHMRSRPQEATGASAAPNAAGGSQEGDRLPFKHEDLSRQVSAAIDRARTVDANPAVIEGLRNARTGLQRLGLRRVLDSDFFGAKTVERPWRIAGNGFEPHWRLGMRVGKEEWGPLARAFDEAWRVIASLFRTPGSRTETAELFAERPFGKTFVLTVRFRTRGDAGKLLIGPFTGTARKDGYRIVYAPQDGHRMELVSVRDGKEKKLAATDRPVELEDGLLHALSWLRTPDGKMTVSVDGTRILSVAAPSGPFRSFDGVTLVAEGGAFSIARVQLDGIRLQNDSVANAFVSR